MAKKPALTEAELTERLRKRYPPPAWAFIADVGNTTGWNQCRRADAVAMSVWPSRGLEFHGFELKSYRSDWVKELNNPEKADPIMKFCDRWWIVVGDKDMVQPGELPPTWGLIVPNGAGLKSVTEAPKLEPQPWTRGFFAAVLRRAAEVYTNPAQLEAARAAGMVDGKKSAESMIKYERSQNAEYKEAIRKFEQKSGVRINTWDGGRVGDAVRIVLNDTPRRYKDQLEELYEDAKRIAHAIGTELKVVSELGEKHEAEESGARELPESCTH